MSTIKTTPRSAPPRSDPPRPAASCFWLWPQRQERRTRPPVGVMKRQLEIAALGVAAAGWLAAVLTRCLALWTVSGTLNNQTASLPAYWDGVWLQWDHWDLAHDGSLHCSFYQSLMSLSGSFRTWRALIMAAIGVGGFAMVVGGVGLVWFPGRGQIKVFSGSFFIVAGILLLVPTAWTCHHTSQPLEGAVPLRRDWGPALYLGWISFALMLVGGVILTTRCPTAGVQEGQPGGGMSPDEEASNPLSTINRTAFTNSQYNRRSPPI
ncbi:PREDICTED: claudin-4-like [Poecilia mexicana]|nr:PREDICTED: claudin-4-like [Poecilia formosa]XP_014847630.1 PREDICTED: claudin-4-like [Poecilia mexicana]